MEASLAELIMPYHLGFPGSSEVNYNLCFCGSNAKESACNAGDLGLNLGSGRFSGEENGYPLQYSCLENSMGRRAWQSDVHEVTKSWTLSN